MNYPQQAAGIRKIEFSVTPNVFIGVQSEHLRWIPAKSMRE
jgi:hypothetical protein